MNQRLLGVGPESSVFTSPPRDSPATVGLKAFLHTTSFSPMFDSWETRAQRDSIPCPISVSETRGRTATQDQGSRLWIQGPLSIKTDPTVAGVQKVLTPDSHFTARDVERQEWRE